MLGIDVGRKVANLQEPIFLSLPLEKGTPANGTNETNATNETLVCAWWSEVDARWATDGCVLDANQTTNQTLVCACTHLTIFSALAKVITNEGIGGVAEDLFHTFSCSNLNFVLGRIREIREIQVSLITNRLLVPIIAVGVCVIFVVRVPRFFWYHFLFFGTTTSSCA